MAKTGSGIEMDVCSRVREYDGIPIRPWTWKDVKIKMCILVGILHLAMIFGFYRLFTGQVCWQTIVLAIIWYVLGGMGITAGAHRLWSHRSYEPVVGVEVFLMLCNCIAFQGSIFHWSRDHVVHHKYSDSIADPHDARRGFFFSHVGWLLVEKQKEVIEAGKSMDLAWLKNNKIVRFQHSNYSLLSLFFSFMMPTAISSCWDDTSNGFWVAAIVRYMVTLHATWCVNSVAHFFGSKPYDPNIKPSESLFTACVSLGEGWHNYHHTFPSDYATSEYGISSQFNPTKLLLDTFSFLGWIKKRKRSVKDWERRLKKINSSSKLKDMKRK